MGRKKSNKQTKQNWLVCVVNSSSAFKTFERCKIISWFAHLGLFISCLRVIWESYDPWLQFKKITNASYAFKSTLLHPGSWKLVDIHVHAYICTCNCQRTRREDSILPLLIRVFVEKVFSCHIYFTRYEHFPARFWHTFIIQKVNITERLVGVLTVCSGGQSLLNISRVPFHELFHGAYSGTCSHTGKTGSERQTEPAKFVWFSHFFNSDASVYSPNHALKYHLTVQRELLPLKP